MVVANWGCVNVGMNVWAVTNDILTIEEERRWVVFM